jgi:hypothetical protein
MYVGGGVLVFVLKLAFSSVYGGKSAADCVKMKRFAYVGALRKCAPQVFVHGVVERGCGNFAGDPEEALPANKAA